MYTIPVRESIFSRKKEIIGQDVTFTDSGASIIVVTFLSNISIECFAYIPSLDVWTNLGGPCHETAHNYAEARRKTDGALPNLGSSDAVPKLLQW